MSRTNWIQARLWQTDMVAFDQLKEFFDLSHRVKNIIRLDISVQIVFFKFTGFDQYRCAPDF